MGEQDETKEKGRKNGGEVQRMSRRESRRWKRLTMTA
jgi:hypothetical protein